MVFWERQRAVSACYEHLTRPVCEKHGLTRMEFDILMFLYNNPQFQTAADIVKLRHFAKSHVSATLSALAEKGLIFRHHGEDNQKSILLELTAAAEPILQAGRAAQETFGKVLFAGFREDEMEQFRQMFQRIYENTTKETE